MLKSKLLAAIQTEILRHYWDTFEDEPPSVAQAGRGVVVTGCSACMVRSNTTSQFVEHVAGSMPALINRLSSSNES
jgi:hypothetical protein